MSPEFRRLAALASSTLRLRIDYLPRSSELLCSAARSGLSRLDQDLHLVLLEDTRPEDAVALLTQWQQNYLFGYGESLADTTLRWRRDRV